VNALNANSQPIAPALKRNLAQAYVELLATGIAAEKAGTQNEPRYKIVMEVVRLRTLSDLYRRDLEDKYRNSPAQEIELYYKQNLSKYEEVKLSRIFIPGSNPAGGDKAAWTNRASQLAPAIRDRAARGEDFSRLQMESYKSLGLTIAPPSTDVGRRRRGMLIPAEEEEMFSLPVGGVSKVEPEPSGYIIYKVESRQTLPLSDVKDEISRELFRQKMEQELKSITNSVHAEYNDQYFGAPAQTSSPSGQPRK
jgi:hypothetical protein